jgi:hypothetical protein
LILRVLSEWTDCRKGFRTTAASSNGYGSGASAKTLYTSRKAFSEALERFVRLSISVW